ncbi:hypothetical protein ACJ41O_015149 [Fusarium nematophilum]
MPTSSTRGPRTKSRSGCEQCKRRKVKCDEQRPTCARCTSRGETCTGNFSFDAWQIERPWAIHDRGPSAPSALENDVLRHWYDKACLNMAIFRPPVNPLSHALSCWLRHSRALRHTLESVADAHREHFVPDRLSSALQSKGLAILSLRNEVARLQSSPTKHQTLLRTTILSSLILCISSAWLDPSGKDFGFEFLGGVSSIVQSLAESAPTDPFAFYLFGLFLYCDAFSSFLVPSGDQHPANSAVLAAVQNPPFDSYIHPVTGISNTLCPLISEAGQHLRRTIDTEIMCASRHIDLEQRLRAWEPPGNAPRQEQLLQLAEGYRSVGMIMLCQARTVEQELGAGDAVTLLDMVLGVMETLKHVPKEDPLLNWVGPLLVIAGSELPALFAEERALVERTAGRLVAWTRIPTYNQELDLVRQVWRLRDSGGRASWLDVMINQGMALAVW